MADYSDEKTEVNDIVARALARAEVALDTWRPIYDKAKEDLHFLSDDPLAQWDDTDYQARIDRKRPTLTVDQLTQFVNQVSNNIRMNTPSINVIPNDQTATPEIAEIFKGRIKDIEHTSKADDAYDTAVNSAIKCSVGFIRIDHQYKDDVTFEQEILIKRVVNPFSVVIDSQSIEPDGSDAMWGLIIDEMTEAQFKNEYPDKDCESFAFDDERESDRKKNVVKVAEYFEIDIERKKIALLQDGTITEFVEGINPLRVRDLEKRTVRRYKLSGKDVLAETTFPGKYIPLVPVYGEEAWEGSKRKINSLIRRSKDAQRMFNYWKSTEAELLIRAPKAVAIAPVGTTEDFADDWRNPDKAAVLRYTPKQAPNGQFLPPPSLNPPPPIPAGIVNASMAAQNDIKSTMGLYNAYIGERSNETSGVAIQARKIEGERAVYHFGDNLVRSITQVGRILVSMIPVIDDTPKLVRVIDESGDTKLVGINGALAEGQEQTYDLRQGQYAVRVTTGGSTPTMRQEAALLFKDIITQQPEMMTVLGDLMFKYQDFPGAQAVAERLKRLLRPELQAEDDEDPRSMALAQENEQLKGALAQLQGEMQSKQAELQLKQQEIAMKAQSEQQDGQLELAKLQIDEARLVAEIRIKEQEMALKASELALKEAEAVAALSQTAGVVAQPTMGRQGQTGSV